MSNSRTLKTEDGSDSRTLETEDGSDTLPVEIWGLIISKLGCFVNDPDYHLKAISLVSKKFLTITNQLKQTFYTSTSATVESCRVLFSRFPNLTRFSLHGDVPNAGLILQKLTCFQLPLQVLDLSNHRKFPREIISLLPVSTRSTLRSLVLNGYHDEFTKNDIGAIADLFPNLEELHLSNAECITDKRIETLASNVNGLRRINLKNNCRLTDKSIISLCKNCPNLEDIIVKGCPDVTDDALAMRSCTSTRWMVEDYSSDSDCDSICTDDDDAPTDRFLWGMVACQCDYIDRVRWWH